MGLSSRQAQSRAQEKHTMNTTEKIGWAVGTVAVAIIVGCFIFAFKGDIQTIAGNITSPATQLDYLNITQGIGFGPNAQTQGSLSTNIMGVRSLIPSTPSLVVCSTLNPFNATSTIINASLTITTGSSSASVIIPTVASTATASTTSIGQGYIVAAGAQAVLQTSGIASSTDLGVAVGPGQFVNWATTASSASGLPYLLGGTCSVLFESAN